MSNNSKTEDNNGLYKVETIVDKRTRKGQIEYYVKWDGYPENENTWEPIDNLIDECHHMIREFEDLRDTSSESSIRTICCRPLNSGSRSVDSKSHSSDSEEETKMSTDSTQSPNNIITDIVIESDNDSDKTEIDSSTDMEVLNEDTLTKKQSDLTAEELDSNDCVVNSLTSKIEDLLTEILTHKTTSEDNTIEKLMEMTSISTEDKSTQIESDINKSAANAVYTGFIDGLTPKEIVAASHEGKQIFFWMQWSNDHISVVSAEEANIRCPQIVIKWYENCLHFT